MISFSANRLIRNEIDEQIIYTQTSASVHLWLLLLKLKAKKNFHLLSGKHRGNSHTELLSRRLFPALLLRSGAWLLQKLILPLSCCNPLCSQAKLLFMQWIAWNFCDFRSFRWQFVVENMWMQQLSVIFLFKYKEKSIPSQLFFFFPLAVGLCPLRWGFYFWWTAVVKARMRYECS